MEMTESAEAVVEMIKDLPLANNITLADKDAVEAARKAYDALSTEAKELVNNLNGLENREAKIAELTEVVAEEAAVVVEMIKELPLANDIVIEDKAIVIAARKAYDALSDEAKELVTNLKGLENREAAIVELEEETAEEDAAVVIEQIKALPLAKDVAIEDKEDIEAARAAFEALSPAAKELVTNLNGLENREAKIVELEKATAEEVVEMIKDLPLASNITLESKADVEAARKAYDALSDKDKESVTNLKGLENREAKIAELEKEEEKTAEEVVEMIKDLPFANNITLDDKADVEAVRKAYDALSDEDKALVTNLKGLENREAKIVELEEVEEEVTDEEAAKKVEDMIRAIEKPDDITGENVATVKPKVEAAREAFDKLTEDQQDLVNNKKGLTNREDKVAITPSDEDLQEQEEIDAAVKIAQDAVNELDDVEITSDNVEKVKTQIAKALPSVLTPERFSRMVLTALTKTPKLADCTPQSFIGAMLTAAQLGLEPNTPLGQAYLIPYGNSCQFQIGYKGLLELAHRSGEVKTLEARCVYENDSFNIEYGLNPNLIHRPCFKDKGELIGVYAVYHTNNGGYAFEFMSKDEINTHKDKFSKTTNKNDSPWKVDYEAMAKKTVIKRLLKYAPLKTEFVRAISEDEKNKTIEFTEEEGILILNDEENAVQESNIVNEVAIDEEN